jgi:hypothetical protein
MRNNRLTTNTTDPNYDLIPFKNKDIDRIQRKSAEQYKAEQDAKREAIRKAKRDEPKMIPRQDPKEKLKSKIN